MYCSATYIQIRHAYGDFMQRESQIYESIISNILVARDVDNIFSENPDIQLSIKSIYIISMCPKFKSRCKILIYLINII